MPSTLQYPCQHEKKLLKGFTQKRFKKQPESHAAAAPLKMARFETPLENH
jgi:hypothetical protein